MKTVRTMDIQTVTMDGQLLRVGIWRGSDASPPLVIFNGIGANLELVQPFVDALGDVEVVMFDIPGVGGSPAPLMPYRFSTLAVLADRLLAGEMMCVFPEGTTTDGQSLLPFHANMFQAAVSASCPVQPICLMYEDAQGRQSTVPAYIGDMSLNDSLNALLSAGALTAHLYVCNPLAPGADRRLLASEAQASVDAALQRMRVAPAVASGAHVADAVATSSSSSSPA